MSRPICVQRNARGVSQYAGRLISARGVHYRRPWVTACCLRRALKSRKRLEQWGAHNVTGHCR